MMRRLAFLRALTLGTLATPLAGEAQQAGKVPRIGILPGRSPSFALRFPELAAELIRLNVDELSEVGCGQGGHSRPDVVMTQPRGPDVSSVPSAPQHATVMAIATTVTTLEAQGDVATVTLNRDWRRIAGRDETRTENVHRASPPQSSV